jgi:hypothetical protein
VTSTGAEAANAMFEAPSARHRAAPWKNLRSKRTNVLCVIGVAELSCERRALRLEKQWARVALTFVEGCFVPRPGDDFASIQRNSSAVVDLPYCEHHGA